jgi:hypothetical protein
LIGSAFLVGILMNVFSYLQFYFGFFALLMLPEETPNQHAMLVATVQWQTSHFKIVAKTGTTMI